MKKNGNFERSRLTLFSPPLALINVNFLGIIFNLAFETLHANFLLPALPYKKIKKFLRLPEPTIYYFDVRKKTVLDVVARMIVTCDSQVKRNINIFLLLLLRLHIL